MRKVQLSLISAMVLAAGISSAASASALENIISNPKVNLEIRPRYEYADVKDNGLDSAKAFTVRTALGLNANLFEVEGLGAQIQMMNVANFGWVDEYKPADPKYDVIMDPSQTRVTQANISYSANGFTGIVGRKMVVLDNARFIGNVGWRQMPQTYDLAAVIYNGIENLSLLGAYVNRVHTVTKDGKIDTGTVLLHAAYKVAPELKITAYDYMVENFADHIGLRLTGTFDLDPVKLSYTAEYAVQNDPSLTDDDDPNLAAAFGGSHTNPDDIEQDADYYNLALNAKYQGFIAGIGYEVLSDAGDGDNEFRTPLATLHAMNGWADVFLKGTGHNVGLEDFTVKLGYNFGEYGKIIGIYHDFSSDKDLSGKDDLGSEIDAAYKYKITKGLGLLLKYANYDAGDAVFGKKDTTKYWVQLDYKFSASM